MGTAVLHPRDCLAPSYSSSQKSHSDDDPRLSYAIHIPGSDCTMLRQALRSVSAAANTTMERSLYGNSSSSRSCREENTSRGLSMDPIQYPALAAGPAEGLLPLPPHHTHAPATTFSPLHAASLHDHRSPSTSSFRCPNSLTYQRSIVPYFSEPKTHRMPPSSDTSNSVDRMHRWFSTPHHVFLSQNQQTLKLADSPLVEPRRRNAMIKQSRKYVVTTQSRQSTAPASFRRHGAYISKRQPAITVSRAGSEKIKQNDAHGLQLHGVLGDEKAGPVTKCSSWGVVSNTTEPGWNCRVEQVFGCLDSSVSEDMSCTLLQAAVVDERWAGPSFFNSPPPSSLPVPSFTNLKLARLATPTCPLELSKDAGYSAAAPQVRQGPGLLDSKLRRTWDVAFATKDLRRLLQLDHNMQDSAN